jgi:hypothetical protein
MGILLTSLILNFDLQPPKFVNHSSRLDWKEAHVKEIISNICNLQFGNNICSSEVGLKREVNQQIATKGKETYRAPSNGLLITVSSIFIFRLSITQDPNYSGERI